MAFRDCLAYMRLKIRSMMMADKAKQPQSEDRGEEPQADKAPQFDPWEAEFKRDLQRNDRDFDF
ncbi:hypothetical protein GOB91_07405 [Sinorhizobium meliloti]|uniref:hypothetical protein n=1 Tax=Rhizobium meliloti TaxID=382 RepID=UPI000FDABFC6|nr:hypothetical protein [Sinorhizobium meliloti]MDW9473128.1 hypothetical protein [Sinorhizobium meliloti]MDW9722181.1 hypothetical protein [Sinorhizobium meliloti]MDW9731409.1 hypothetical protein [Sinorhizobium meliloti]MDW9891170.1 hypothetical protein [Sinorhizobium meliloti]MDX0094161.1 hypothetical protein [Sinorhizobium meliloti]